MERIMGINEARPKLSTVIDSLDEPVIITVNSEPKSVLVRYDEYLRLIKAEEENKRLALRLAVEKARSLAKEELTSEDVSKEIEDYRKAKRGIE